MIPFCSQYNWIFEEIWLLFFQCDGTSSIYGARSAGSGFFEASVNKKPKDRQRGVSDLSELGTRRLISK